MNLSTKPTWLEQNFSAVGEVVVKEGGGGVNKSFCLFLGVFDRTRKHDHCREVAIRGCSAVVTITYGPFPNYLCFLFQSNFWCTAVTKRPHTGNRATFQHRLQQW